MMSWLMLKGMVEGIESMGATWIKIESNEIHFKLNTPTQLTESAKDLAEIAFKEQFNLTIIWNNSPSPA